jgi:cyclin-dependent kinase-like
MNREIRVLKDYQHGNIVDLTHVFKEEGKLFLVFDYVPQTLLELLQKTPKGVPSEKIKMIIF